MSLVTDLINNISPLQKEGSLDKVSKINFNDTTFSNLLDKALNVQQENKIDDSYMYLGAPAGFEMQELKIDNFDEKSDNKITENLLDFAKKQAANYYYKYSGSVVTDLKEFVEDALKLG